jgi:hypothetical protein
MYDAHFILRSNPAIFVLFTLGLLTTLRNFSHSVTEAISQLRLLPIGQVIILSVAAQ